jgi:hypothetical protein
VGSATFGGASASTGINFTRTFQLSGSPDGWNVTLSARLVGLLLAAFNSSPTASVTASASISGGPAINFGTISVTEGRQNSVDDARDQTAVLADGTYTTQGGIETAASISASGIFMSGTAFADFFANRGGQPSGLFVAVDAKPIPEPSMGLLCATAIFSTCVCIGIARRRKPTLKIGTTQRADLGARPAP